MADLGLSGLASGVDTSAIVEQLMAIERRARPALQLRQQRASRRSRPRSRTSRRSSTALKTAAADLRVEHDLGRGPDRRERRTPRASRSRARAARRSAATAIKVTQLAALGAEDLRLDAEPASRRRRSRSTTATAASGPITLDIAADAKIADVATAINGRATCRSTPPWSAATSSSCPRARPAPPSTFSATGAQLTGPSSEVAGRDALYELDGVAAPPSATNVIEDAIPGVRVTLKGTRPTR